MSSSTTPSFSRRDLLRGLGLSVAVVGCGGEWLPGEQRAEAPPGPPDLLDENLSAFPEGLMAGPPTTSGLELWARYAGDESLTLVWWLWDGASWSEQPARDVVVADGGYVHPQLLDLPPDQCIAAQLVTASGLASAGVLTRTAPSPTAGGRVRVLATSCSEYHPEGFPALDHALAGAPYDLAVWAGDTVYADGATTLEDYRAIWSQSFSTEAFRRTFSMGSQLFTWDDHEVVNDWDPQNTSAELVQTASQAFAEHTPRPLESGAPGRRWYQVRYGAAVEFFVLDCRGERSPDRQEYVSPEQLAWLIQGLRASTARFKCIVNSVPISDFPAVFDVPVVISDRWEGYPAQRDEFLAAVAEVRGAFFLSGDFHMPAVLRAADEGPLAHIWEIVTGALSHRTNPSGAYIHTHPELAPNIAWTDGMKTATELEFDEAGFLTIRFVGEDGTYYFEGVLTDGGALLSATVREVMGA